MHFEVAKFRVAVVSQINKTEGIFNYLEDLHKIGKILISKHSEPDLFKCGKKLEIFSRASLFISFSGKYLVKNPNLERKKGKEKVFGLEWAIY